MKLYFDPTRSAIVTETGEPIEGITRLDISYNPPNPPQQYFTLGSSNPIHVGGGYGPRIHLELECMEIREIPEVAPALVQGAVDGLKRIESDLDRP